MGFSLSNLFDPAGVFSGDKGDIFGAIVDPGGSTMQNFGLDSDWRGFEHDDVSNWADDIADSNSIMAQNRWKNVREGGLKRFFQTPDPYGAGTPTGTRLTNKIYGTDYKPLWTSLGDTTRDDQQEVVNRGQDLSNYQGVRTVGESIGNGFLNAFTFGLGSTAAQAADNYGYGESNDDLLKKAAKDYAIKQAVSYGGEQMGSIPEMGGYNEVGGGYVANSDYGGTGGFNLGKAVGAGDYSPQVNAIAKAGGQGALSAAVAGGNSTDISKGALQGAGMQGIKAGGGVLSDFFMSPQEDDTIRPYGSSPAQVDMSGPAAQSLADITAPQASQERPYGSTPNSNYQPMSFSMEQPQSVSGGGSSNPVQQFISSFSGGGGGQGGGNYGDLAAGLFGMYNANKQRKRLKEQSDSLNSLFSPNSPYAQQMRQRLERRDAAAGRRSQYGPREAQLAALLADRQAQTMPQQEKYAQGIGGYENAMANIGLRGASSLYDMYRRPSAPMMGGSTRGYDPYSNPVYFGGGEGE